MNKIISIIVILLLVVGIIFYIKKDKAPVTETPVDTTSVSTSTSKTIGGVKTEDGALVSFPAMGVYKIDTTSSKVNWTGRKVVLKNWVDTGTIKIKEGSMEFTKDGLVSNSFVIDMSTIQATKTGAGKGEDKLSTHLKSNDFFDIENYPTATFVAKEFSVAEASTSTEESIINVKGDLTIKGVTREVVIPITPNYNNPTEITMKGSVDIDRTLWDIKYGSEKFFKSLGDNVIDDMFNISFDIKLKK